MAHPTSPGEDDALHQACALLAELRARAESEAPALRGELARLDALLAAASLPEAALRALRDESAEYASLIAHEVRVPLTSLRGYADMLRQGIAGPLNETQAQFVEVIRDNAIRMEALIANINDLSKIRAGRLKLNRAVTAYADVVAEVERQTRPIAEERAHTLTFNTPDGLPHVNADCPRLIDALVKLVANALLYTPAGKGQITVSAASDSGKLRVSIADNGIGMSAEERARLGEPFWRADHDLVRAHKGHGLGFAVARGVIALLEGEVGVASTPGAGTTVTLTLPGAEPAPSEETTPG